MTISRMPSLQTKTRVWQKDGGPRARIKKEKGKRDLGKDPPVAREGRVQIEKASPGCKHR